MTVDEFKQWRPSRQHFEFQSPLQCENWIIGATARFDESTRVELKREFNNRNPLELPKYICGFRNGDGGYLCFSVEETGVEGQGKIIGIESLDADEIEETLRRDASQFHPPVLEVDVVRVNLSLDVPDRVVTVFCISPSKSKTCTQLKRPKSLDPIPFFEDDDLTLLETRKAYFGTSTPVGVVDVISRELVFKFGNGWRVRSEFFRPSSPWRQLEAAFLLIVGHGVICSNARDAKLLMTHLWRFGLVRISIGEFSTNAELEIAKR